jgi:hypothetical protein
MPFTGPDDPNLPSNVQSRDERIRAQWVEVWNGIFNRCILINRDKTACEADAFRQANGVIKMADLKTRDVPDQKVLKVGRWHGQGCPEKGCEFTAEHLDAMVETYKETKGEFEPPVKLGHNERQRLLGEDGLPNAGTMTNIRRSGEFLVADLKDVPETVADLIDANGFNSRSAEILQDHTIGEKKFKWALVGLALLGETLPAVTGLGDVEKLYQSLHLELDEKAAIVIFEEGTQLADVDALLGDFEKTATAISSLIKNRRGAPTVRELARAFREGVKRALNPKKFAGDGGEVDMALAEQLRTLLGLKEGDDVVEAIKLLHEKAKTMPKKGDDDPKDGDVAQLRADLDEASQQIVKLTGEGAARQATELVDGLIAETRLLPAQRGEAIKMALRDYKGAKAFFETQQKGAIKLGERGTADDETIAGLEPTESQIEMAKSMGIWSPEQRILIMRDNATAKGIELPADFGKTKKDEDD